MEDDVTKLVLDDETGTYPIRGHADIERNQQPPQSPNCTRYHVTRIVADVGNTNRQRRQVSEVREARQHLDGVHWEIAER